MIREFSQKLYFMRILISELSENHHETLLALIAYAAALSPEAICVVAPPSWGNLYQSLSEVQLLLPYEGSERLGALVQSIQAFRPAVLIHTTAYGREPLALAKALSHIPQVGVVHNIRKLRRFSYLQWRLIRRLRAFFVLRPRLHERIPSLYRSSAAYLMSHVYPTSLERQVPEQILPKGPVYVAIPGRIEYKRRDYEGLLEALRFLRAPERFRFLLLGPAAAEYSDYMVFEKGLRRGGWQELFISFTEVIPFPAFHGYLRASAAVLPLIHPWRNHTQRTYLRDQISGAFSAAQAHQKPLLLHRDFVNEPDLADCGFFYGSSAELAHLLDYLACGKLPLDGLYRGSWWSMEASLAQFRWGLDKAISP